ncbi:MAG: hypothetical protein MUE54_06195 [Anaerolineae bacterium]|nr:hypothetical protein [Anaerolineae bacterium]
MTASTRKKSLIIALIIVASLLFNIIPSLGAVVLPSDYQGLTFTDSTIPIVFADGPATPPLGTGSLTATIAGAGQRVRFYEEYGTFDGSFNLTGGLDTNTFTLSYSTYTDPTATNTNSWYANIYLLLDSSFPATHVFAGPIPNCFRLDFVPADNPADGTWRTYTLTGTSPVYALAGCFGSPGTLTTWSAFFTTPPISGLVNNPRVTAVALNIGDSASTYVGYVGAFDNLEINGTVYDFELTPPVAIPEVEAPAVASPPVTGCIYKRAPGFEMSNQPDNTYCTSLIQDGAIVAYPGAIPENLIRAGVIRAVDIFRLEGGRSIATFPDYAQACLLGDGRFIYMDATQAPRQQVEMPTTLTEISGSTYTCAWIPNPGTVILINK